MSQAMARQFTRCRGKYLPQHSFSRLNSQEERWSFPENHTEECAFFGRDMTIPYGAVLEKAAKDFPSIAMDYDVLCGAPRIAGTRVPVYMVIDAVQYYGDVDGALKSYPHLTREQVREALCFAGAVLEQPIEYES